MKGPAGENQKLLEENAALKQRIQELEQSESDCRRAEQGTHHSQETAERLAKEMAIIAEIGRVIGSTPEIDEVFERSASTMSGWTAPVIRSISKGRRS